MGKIYLAYEKNSDYLKQYWQSNHTTIEALTANTITDLTVMEQELAEIRKEQFAMDREENELGVVCIAAPVFDYLNNVDYAISISMSIYKLKQQGIRFFVDEIQQAARDISKELGYISE